MTVIVTTVPGLEGIWGTGRGQGEHAVGMVMCLLGARRMLIMVSALFIAAEH